MKVCSIPNCGSSKRVTKGMCIKHYDLQRRRGSAYAVSVVDGRTKHPLYPTWYAMMARCYNPKAINYGRYGGRGITVCERWSNFHNFIADMGDKPKGKTLDRKNNDKGYSPDNCQWETPSNQTINQRLSKANVSGYKGVTPKKNRWQVNIMRNGNAKYLGSFQTVEAAKQAYDVALERYQATGAF